MRALLAKASVFVSVLVLAACSEKAAEPAALASEGPELAGVKLVQSLRALGNEPFWGVDIEPTRMTYKPLEGEVLTLEHEGPEVTGNVAVWKGKGSTGPSLTVTLTGTDCSDGMSDRTYPLTAQVELGDTVLLGCAASTEALHRAGEGGRVQ